MEFEDRPSTASPDARDECQCRPAHGRRELPERRWAFVLRRATRGLPILREHGYHDKRSGQLPGMWGIGRNGWIRWISFDIGYIIRRRRRDSALSDWHRFWQLTPEMQSMRGPLREPQRQLQPYLCIQHRGAAKPYRSLWPKSARAGRRKFQ
jgi:hypothetical protein